MKEKSPYTNTERLAQVLEWLYVFDGACKSKKDWREELVAQLYFLADIEYPDSNGAEEPMAHEVN